uniref:Uncharacterized protein n=1 Tax=Anopheles maculatus TaxID=74869 RepID=A0A182T5B4_9DIPT
MVGMVCASAIDTIRRDVLVGRMRMTCWWGGTTSFTTASFVSHVRSLYVVTAMCLAALKRPAIVRLLSRLIMFYRVMAGAPCLAFVYYPTSSDKAMMNEQQTNDRCGETKEETKLELELESEMG